jgi:hypothetical protein
MSTTKVKVYRDILEGYIFEVPTHVAETLKGKHIIVEDPSEDEWTLRVDDPEPPYASEEIYVKGGGAVVCYENDFKDAYFELVEETELGKQVKVNKDLKSEVEMYKNILKEIDPARLEELTKSRK